MYILQSTFCCTYIFDETYVQISGGRATGKRHTFFGYFPHMRNEIAAALGWYKYIN